MTNVLKPMLIMDKKYVFIYVWLFLYINNSIVNSLKKKNAELKFQHLQKLFVIVYWKQYNQC